MVRTWRTGSLRASIAIGVAIGLLGMAIGVAVASIPAANGAINSCYSVRTGALRVIDSPTQKCVSGERALRWNQTGPANVAALHRTPCTAGPGTAGTLNVSVSPTNGLVSMQCLTVLSVSSSVTVDRIDLAYDIATGPFVKECATAKTCAASYPLGTSNASVHIFWTSAFGYTCPGGVPTRSIALSSTIQHAECPNISMTVNRVVTVTP